MNKREIKTELVKISELVNLEKNPRKIGKEEMKRLKKKIQEHKEFLFCRPVLVNNSSGKNIVYAGNQRLKACKELGMKEIPAIIESINQEEQDARTIIDNKSDGEWDFDLLKDWDQKNLEEWGVEIDFSETLNAEQDDFDLEKDLENNSVITKKGDIYEIGSHRILCGDSTLEEDVKKLMNEKVANLLHTDPPYNMNFKGSIGRDGSNSKAFMDRKIQNDNMSDIDFYNFMSKVLRNIKTVLNGSFYFYFYRLGIYNFYKYLNDADFCVRNVIIWKKNNFNLNNSDYNSLYEPIFYGWNGVHNFYGGNSNADIWEVDKILKNDLHPTMKPINLCSIAINNSSKINDIVLDLFLGSGSTMVASHQLKRTCYGMEIEPKYCDVVIRRMIHSFPDLEIKRNGKKIDKQLFNA